MGRTSWEDACRQVMPEVAAAMRMPLADLRWVAAMHRRPTDGTPHVHILFWSQDPSFGYRRIHVNGVTGVYPQIAPKALDQIKRRWISELYGRVRSKLGKEKTGLRAQASETAWREL